MGAEFLVVPRPGFGDLEKLSEAADLIALEVDLQAIGRLAHLEVDQFPGEGVVRAVFAFNGFGFDELQGGDRALQGVDEELFGQVAGFDLAEPRSFAVLFDEVAESDQFAGGGHFYLEFLLL